MAQGVVCSDFFALFAPPPGTRVLVDFVDAHTNHPCTIAGWHSQHLDRQGANQWLLDDATGQLRMRLASHSLSTGWSELSMGHLIAQSGQGGAGHAQRGAWLGEGFYGHTDGWAVVRAGQGLLLSTTARTALGASVQSTQMDAQEAVAQLKAARQLGQALSDSARQQGAHGLHSHDSEQAWQNHTGQMDPQAQGRHPAQVNGQDARKAQAHSRALGDPVERFNEPLIHFDTPASSAWVSPSSLHFYSGQDQSLTAQGDVQLTSAHALSSVSGQTSSLYTHAGGIQAVAANAALSLRAHTDAQQIWSEQDLTVQSTSDEIRIQAAKRITLTAGQSQIVIEGSNITFTCPGTWTVKGGSHDWSGGGSQAANLVGLPDAAAANLPAPSFRPTLEQPWFSEAIGFSAFPHTWLPFGGDYKASALNGQKPVGLLSAVRSDEFTASLITDVPQPVRYSLSLANDWSIERAIEVAVFDGEADSEDENGGHENA